MTTTNHRTHASQQGPTVQATSQPGGPRRCPAWTRSLGSGRWRFLLAALHRGVLRRRQDDQGRLGGLSRRVAVEARL